MPSPTNTPVLLNRVEIPGVSGYTALELWQGDLLEWQESLNVLCFSVGRRDLDRFSSADEPLVFDYYLVPQLISAGLNIIDERDKAELRLENGLGLWISNSLEEDNSRRLNPKRLVCIYRVGKEPDELRRTFTDMFAALA